MKDCMCKARTIRPTTYKNKFLKCIGCGIKYSKRDYNILYKAQKIVYFIFAGEKLCHDCFHGACETIMEKEGLDVLRVELQDGRRKVVLSIEREE